MVRGFFYCEARRRAYLLGLEAAAGAEAVALDFESPDFESADLESLDFAPADFESPDRAGDIVRLHRTILFQQSRSFVDRPLEEV